MAMSRMQTILDKAERDGAVLRLRPLAADQAAFDTPSSVAAAPGYAPATTPAHTPIRSASPRLLDRALVAAGASEGKAARQYRGLCTRIVHADAGSPVKVVMITSPGAGEGKSVTAANLALTMAREYKRPTCLIDANLRSPKLQTMFGLDDGPGLIDVLAGRATLDQALTLVEPAGVTVLPAGRGNEHPADLLGTPTMRRIIDGLRAQFDRIIIDTPATLGGVDMGMLGPLADRIVLVVRADVTAKAAIQDAMSAIDSSRLLGVVLNEAA
jgi:capsular exopolysaccharide synthesis family protein